MTGQRRNDGRSKERSPEGLWPDIADRTSGVRARSRTHSDPGELLGGVYRLLGPIGDTSYGRGVRAEHVGTGREVAVHMIAESEVSERVLVRELPLVVAKCAQLTHPNVVTLQAFGRVNGDAGPLYVVTDALEGVSLEDYLHTQGEISMEVALALARQIGRALRAAHKLDIVHGDLRPANVCVVASADGLQVRVTGFGRRLLARAVDEPGAGMRFVGSPSYASPELLGGESPDVRADIYALGAILYRMISGAPPRAAATHMDPTSAQENQPARAPIPSLRARMGDAVSEPLDALVMRCLAECPQERFSDVVAVMSAMRFLTLNDSDFLSREHHETSSFEPFQANSILPTVPPIDPTDERAAIASGAKLPASDRRFWLALALWTALCLLTLGFFELTR